MAAEYKRGMSRLAGRVAELEKVLKIYDNPHTPPSRRAAGPKKKEAAAAEGSPSPPGRKQGAQEGHPGKTSRPKPDRFEEHRMRECSACGSRRIRATGRRIRDITEITPPPPPVTTRHTIHVYDCAGCGRGGMEPETGLPERGMLGPRASAEIVGNFLDRMPHRMNARRMARAGLPVSAGTVHNVLSRVGRNLEAHVASILAVLVAADVLHIDETSFRLNGRTVWVWIFLDPVTEAVLYVLRPSRGRDVLQEVLPGFKGVIVCDGWKPYRAWDVQRCWAHILREARYLVQAHPRSRAARDVLARLVRAYGSACDSAGTRMPRARRARARASLLGHLTRIVDDSRGSAVARRFLGKLGRAAPGLLEFVADPRIPPTNNAAERGLREIVIHRKIRGTLRSEAGMENIGNILTCAATWKNAGLDYVAEMQKYA